ncbi:MAG: glucose 1-dehydrogenase [Planctomycetaceae bacterium]|nr:glucose 1-dehydrogenase [Planctomycetales bacterium]MCB9921791.1 glucose 1-dehydrogenase [Planctomycetaceae bacterium]
MNDQLFSVADQVVIVSGGSRGIGRAIAKGFADRRARVVITGRDESSLSSAADAIAGGRGNVTPIVCDVAKSDDIERLVTKVINDFGYIDTLVNVAGVNRRKPALEVSEDDYDFILDINLKGAFMLSQAVGRQMVERGSGCQINIASLNTDRPLKDVLPYAMSKAGIAHMTRGLALEWGPSGVRVNGIAPGFILTDLTEKLWSDEKMQAWGKANTPQRRLGIPEDMVGAAIFLASPAASFMTGQTLYVDGGYTAGWSWPIPEGGGQR